MAVYRIDDGAKILFADVSKIQSINNLSPLPGQGTDLTFTADNIPYDPDGSPSDERSLLDVIKDVYQEISQAGKVDKVNGVSPVSKEITILGSDIAVSGTIPDKIDAFVSALQARTTVHPGDMVLSQDTSSGLQAHISLAYDDETSELRLLGKPDSEHDDDPYVISSFGFVLPSIKYSAVLKYTGSAWLEGPDDLEIDPGDAGLYLVIGYMDQTTGKMTYSHADLSELVVTYNAGYGLALDSTGTEFSIKIDALSTNLKTSDQGLRFEVPSLTLAQFEAKTEDGIYFVTDDAVLLEDEEGDGEP